MTVTIDHAASRAWVTLPDGRSGRLISIPQPGRGLGRKARVQLQGGSFASVDVGDLTLVKGKAHRGRRAQAPYWPAGEGPPRLPDGTVDVRALCRRWDDQYNEALR